MSKLKRPSYATKIANLRSVHLEHPSESMWPLLKELGCVRLDHVSRFDADGEITSWSVTKPKRVPRTQEALIRETLTLVLDVYAEDEDFICQDDADSDLALLDGLSKHRRYLSCFKTEIGAYNLARLLTNITERKRMGVNSHGDRYNYLPVMQAANAEAFCHLVNDWIQPEKPFLTTPDTDTLLRALFGDSLCDLMGRAGALALFRAGTQPPFLPGLLPARFETAAVALPHTDIA